MGRQPRSEQPPTETQSQIFHLPPPDISPPGLQDDAGIYQIHPGWTRKLCVTTEPDLED